MAATDFVTNPVMKAFLAGSLSGTCSTLLFQPLDLVKTRVQQTSGLSVARVVEAVLQRDSVRGLWRGLVPSMARTVPGVGIYFSAMHHMKTSVCGGQPSHLQSVMIGCSARATAATLMIPLTVIKTRFESRSFGYTSTAAALRSVLGTEGVRGLVRGLGPTLVRDVPFSGLYLMFYEHLKSVAAAAQLAGSGAHFTCGVLAGVLASLVTQRPGFRLVPAFAGRQCTNVGFWYIPPSLRDLEETEDWWRRLEEVAPRIKERMIREGSLMIGYQPLPYKNLKNFFRFVLHGVPRPTKENMEFVVNEIERIGNSM